MKKGLSSLLLSGLLLSSVGFGGSVVRAAEENVTGEDSASITVNGSLGQDNTDPEQPVIPDGDKDWINITLNTANVFYTTKATDHKTIASPDYTITNNSGRAVKVSANSFTVNSGNLDNVDALAINGKDYAGADKSINLKNFSAGEFVTLANNEGKVNVNTDANGAHKNSTVYTYAGTTKDDFYKKATGKTAHTLTLSFEALGKDGNSVAKP